MLPPRGARYAPRTGLLDEIRAGTYRPAGPPVVVRGRLSSLAETASRVAAGTNLLLAVREFLDQLDRTPDDELARLIRDRPLSTGSAEGDALLAGLAEHVAATRGVGEMYVVGGAAIDPAARFFFEQLFGG